jgi:hypothetical protein
LQFLNIIRTTQPSHEEIQAILSNCFVPEEGLDEHINSQTTIICSHREDVSRYNKIVFEKNFHPYQRKHVQMETNAAEIESIASWLFDTRFNYIEIVAVECLIMFTKNVNILKGTINGATATVQEIECSSDRMVTSITVQLIDSKVKMKLKLQTFQYRYTYEAYHHKASFPIVLAYAITGHKSQGATIATNVLINIQNAFSPRLTYVMLFQVTNQRNLKIRGTLSPTDFIPCTPQIE